MRKLRAVLVEALKDPDSAKFKDEFLSLPEDSDSNVRSLCGLVNARNSYGGYPGFTAFIVNTDGLLSIESSESPNFRRFVWPVWCSRPL